MNVRVPMMPLAWAGGLAAGAGGLVGAQALLDRRDGADLPQPLTSIATAATGVAGAALAVAGKGHAPAKLAGGALFGAATGAGAVQLSRTDQFRSVTEHELLRYAVVPAAIWTGIGTMAVLGGGSSLGRVHSVAKHLVKDERIGVPTKIAAGLMMTPLHPVDWAAGAVVTGSMLRRTNREALRDAWQASRPMS